MPDLIAKPALGHAPITLAGTTLAQADWTPIFSIAAFPGQDKPLAKALKPLGLAMPAANSWAEKGQARIVWTGRDQAFLIGTSPPADLPAAITDQSDAWVTLTLSGPQARATLARLVPLDLRAARAGQCARTGLNHMPLILICEGPETFRLMTFRSMARTAWHELHEALVRIEARLAFP